MPRLTDEQIEDLVHQKLFGDLDDIEGHAMFDESPAEAEGKEEIPAVPAGDIQGVSVEIKPITAEAKKDDEEEEDPLKGISNLSPLMSRLHPGR